MALIGIMIAIADKFGTGTLIAAFILVVAIVVLWFVKRELRP